MLTKQEILAKVAAFAEMIDYPCTKQELLQMANEQEFPDLVLDVLEDLPGMHYASDIDVVEAAQGVKLPERGRVEVVR